MLRPGRLLATGLPEPIPQRRPESEHIRKSTAVKELELPRTSEILPKRRRRRLRPVDQDLYC